MSRYVIYYLSKYIVLSLDRIPGNLMVIQMVHITLAWFSSVSFLFVSVLVKMLVNNYKMLFDQTLACVQSRKGDMWPSRCGSAPPIMTRTDVVTFMTTSGRPQILHPCLSILLHRPLYICKDIAAPYSFLKREIKDRPPSPL